MRCALAAETGGDKERWLRRSTVLVLLYEGIVAQVFDYDYAPSSEMVESRRMYFNISQVLLPASVCASAVSASAAVSASGVGITGIARLTLTGVHPCRQCRRKITKELLHVMAWQPKGGGYSAFSKQSTIQCH